MNLFLFLLYDAYCVSFNFFQRGELSICTLPSFFKLKTMDSYTKRVALKMTLLSQLLLDELDDLKQTTIYRQQFRNLVGKLESELEKSCKLNFDTLYNEDATNELNLLNEVVDSIIHKSLNTDIKFKTPHYLYCDKKSGKRILSTLKPEEFFKK